MNNLPMLPVEPPDSPSDAVECQNCHGKGEREFLNCPITHEDFGSVDVCEVCNGEGYITREEAEKWQRENTDEGETHE